MAITIEQARSIAADWHDGQFSALYKLSSSGYIDADGIWIEAHTSLHLETDPVERARLETLLTFADENGAN